MAGKRRLPEYDRYLIDRFLPARQVVRPKGCLAKDRGYKGVCWVNDGPAAYQAGLRGCIGCENQANLVDNRVAHASVLTILTTVP